MIKNLGITEETNSNKISEKLLNTEQNITILKDSNNYRNYGLNTNNLPPEGIKNNKKISRVIIGKNIILREIHTPEYTLRKINKKLPDESIEDTFRKNRNDTLENIIVAEQLPSIDQQIRRNPKFVESSELNIRERCKRYFLQAREAGAVFNDLGGNNIYNETPLRDFINTKVPESERNKLAPRTGEGLFFQGNEAQLNGIWKYNGDIIFSNINYSGLPGVISLTSGGWRGLIRVDDSGGNIRRVVVGDANTNLTIRAGSHRPHHYTTQWATPLAIQQDLYWVTRHYGFHRPGSASFDYPGDWTDMYVSTYLGPGSDDIAVSDNCLHCRILRGYAGVYVGIDPLQELENVVRYDGGHRLIFGEDLGRDQVLRSITTR